MGKRALIFGVSGQDGAYMAKLLLQKGYEVHGTSRDVETSPFLGLNLLGIRSQIHLHSVAPNDFRNVLQVLSKVEPDEAYYLAGQSSVALSFDQPIETLESVAVASLNILEAIRLSRLPIKFFNACSGECFGDTSERPAGEDTTFRPRSPYASAKAAAFWQVANYREAYGLFACSGILFNHESPLRSERFVTRKITAAAARISGGSRERLALGNLITRRDWGWAPEYVQAMWLMLQQEQPEDFVIATGECNSLEAFVEAAFSWVGLDWREHVTHEKSLLRPTDILVGFGDPSKAKRLLGWEPKYKMRDVVRLMVDAEISGIIDPDGDLVVGKI